MTTPTSPHPTLPTVVRRDDTEPSGGVLPLLAAQIACELRQAWRVPEFVIGVIAVPVILYAMFALPNAGQTMAAGTPVCVILVGSFSAYAVVSMCLFTFGVDVANERAGGWLRRLRATPMPMWAYFAAKLTSALVLTTSVYIAIWAVAVAFGDVRLPVREAALGLIALCGGTLAFSTLGFALAFSVRQKAVSTVANLLFLPLSFCSGFFTPLGMLPQVLRDLAPWLPTHHFGILVWRALAPERDVVDLTGHTLDPVGVQLAWVVGTVMCCGALAAWAYRRDSRRERE